MNLEADKQPSKTSASPQAVNDLTLRRFLGMIMAGLVFIVLVLGFAFYGPGRGVQTGFNIMGPGSLSFGSFTPQMPNLPFGNLTHSMTVLFMGTDVVYEKDGRKLLADRAALNGRSDTMMLVYLNPLRNKISVLHIPRDTEAYVGKYGIQKINFANAVGGPDCARTAVSGLLDVNIDHYVVMNISGLVDLVNELGGVTVEIPKKMKYMDWSGKLKIDLDPGWHTLTGNQAMGFVRFRHDDLGDIGRVQRQQLFLQAVARKMMDPRSWMHVPALIEIGKKSIQTDMSEMEMIESINFAHTVTKENLKFVMLPGQFSGNGDWLAGADAKVLAQQLADPGQEYVASRRNISICIQNASSDKDLGYKLARALHKLGYITIVGKTADGTTLNGKSKIIDQNGNSSNANMLRGDLGGVGNVVDASIGDLYSSITLIANDDIKLDQIAMSSVDAPYVVPSIQPPLVQAIVAKHTRSSASEITTEGEPEVPTDSTASPELTQPGLEMTPPTESPAAGASETNSQSESTGNAVEREAPKETTPSLAPVPGNSSSETEKQSEGVIDSAKISPVTPSAVSTPQ
jgi:polyisoprenyl-teichoic acid--peptidoglycan teichoic acid transferase